MDTGSNLLSLSSGLCPINQSNKRKAEDSPNGVKRVKVEVPDDFDELSLDIDADHLESTDPVADHVSPSFQLIRPFQPIQPSSAQPHQLKESLQCAKTKNFFTVKELDSRKAVRKGFHLAVQSVQKSDLITLFSEDDGRVLTEYSKLNKDHKMLLVMLLLKKPKWAWTEGMNIPGWTDEKIGQILNDLCGQGFLLNSSKIDDLEQALHLLDVKQLKKATAGFTKKQARKEESSKTLLIANLLQFAQNTRLRTLQGESMHTCMLLSVSKTLKEKIIKVNLRTTDDGEKTTNCNVLLKVLLAYFQPVDADILSYYWKLL